MTWREAEATLDHPALGESTLPRAFEDSADRHEADIAQLYKGGIADRSLVAAGVLEPALDGEFASLTYGRLREVVRTLAAGFRELGVDPDDRVGIFARTRMEWAQCDLGLLAAGAVVTTLYPSASTDQVRSLLADSGAVGVVVEDATLLNQVLAVADDTDCEFAVVIDELDMQALEYDPRAVSMRVHSLATVCEIGADAFDRERYEDWLRERDPTDLATLLYTSGTTGDSRGVPLTHGNVRANLNQCVRRFGARPDKPPAQSLAADDRAVSVLPLSHVFERLAGHFLLLLLGVTIAYAESTDTLQEDFTAVRPTVGTSVPRIYERLADAIQEQASESRPKRHLFEWARRVATSRGSADDPGLGVRIRHAIADRLVFRRVRGALGGQLKFLISGGGSLSPELCELYHAMGIPVLEGYGLTEASPVIAANPPSAPEVGTVGPPLHQIDIRLDTDVGTSIDPVDGGDVGELLVRGPNVFDGYWNDPEATDAAFTDGWFRTGDIVERRSDGYLRFRERAKEVLALSTGKNVPPVPLEDALAADQLIEQAIVVGDGKKFVSALLVPDLDAVRAWARADGIDLPSDSGAVCADKRVHDRVEQTVEQVNEEFERHERVKRFRLVPEAFTETNGLLTPTLKKKRRAILERYRETIEAMYEE